MARPYIVIDFETASKSKLDEVGSWRYAEDPSTEILCLAGLAPGGEPWLWTPDGTGDTPGARQLLEDAVTNDEVWFVAHNCGFEKAIWRQLMPRYGFDDILNARWHDTMAVCAMRRLPLGLADVITFLGLHIAKDTEGGALVKRLSAQYRRPGGTLDRSRATLDKVYRYCLQDVRAQMALHLALGRLLDNEREVWLLDQTINERGVALDSVFVEASQKVVDLTLPDLAREFAALTGGLKHGQIKKFHAWLRDEQYVWLDDMTKATVDKSIGGEHEEDEDGDLEGTLGAGTLPPDAHRALTLRSLMRSTSIVKLQRMAECVGAGGRARGLLQYHGAGPGRWAGRLIQPQNFPRGSLPPEMSKEDGPDLVVATIQDAARSQAPYHVERILGKPPVETVSSALRHCIIPGPGNMLVAGDFAQIEARIVLALAGQADKVALFASGAPVYADMAQAIYGRPVTKADNIEEYTIGKNTVLGCGFGMGWRKFHHRYCPLQSPEFAQQVIHTYRFDWAPHVQNYWDACDGQSNQVMWDGHYAPKFYRNNWEEWAQKQTHVKFTRTVDAAGTWMNIFLPSGRRLWYYSPVPTTKEIYIDQPDGTQIVKTFDNGQVCMSYDWDYLNPGLGGKGRRVNMYGGLITENIVQGLARDIMVAAMFRLENELGFKIVLTVHDEIVCEVPKTWHSAADDMRAIMCEAPAWANDLSIPVAAETWQGTRYRK